eukprot:IDg2123t1
MFWWTLSFCSCVLMSHCRIPGSGIFLNDAYAGGRCGPGYFCVQESALLVYPLGSSCLRWGWWRISTAFNAQFTLDSALAAKVVSTSYKQATAAENIEFWSSGIAREDDAIARNNTSELVQRER